MDKNATRALIESEGLRNAVWYAEPANHVNAIAIYSEGAKWVVSATDERAVEIGRELFENEGRALESFLKRLHALNRFLKIK